MILHSRRPNDLAMSKRTGTTTAAAVVLAAVLAGSQAADAQQFQDQTSARFPTQSEYSNQVTAGDIDGDGDLDLIFANGGNFSSPGAPQKVRVYINNGAGFFTDESDARTGGHAGLYRGVELGDCENDGDLDIILAQDFNQRPNLLVNNGAGVFTVEGPSRLPPIPLSSSRAQFGDVDNDGDLDIFITNGGASNRFGCGQYRLYINDGTGHYTDETSGMFPIGNVCQNMDCIFGDIDNDFDLDIRTASVGTNNSRLYRNNGAGVYTLVAGVPSDSTCYSYDFGDIDGDGDLDLLGVNGGSGSSEILLRNDGMGGYTNVSGQIIPNPNQDDNDSKFFDYDNDGDLDLIIARLGSGGEKIYNNNGSGTFTQVSGLITVISDSSLDVIVADLTGDNRLDIVTAQGESGSFQNRIYINISGPSDTIPPNVWRTEQMDDTEDTDGPYVVRAMIYDGMTSDRNFFYDSVELHYTVGPGPEQMVPMQYSGGQIFRGEIPGQPGGGLVEYWVIATDAAGNTGMGDVLSFNVEGGGVFGDLDGDGSVNAADLAMLLAAWGPVAPCPPNEPADLNQDCMVDASDLAMLLAAWT